MVDHLKSSEKMYYIVVNYLFYLIAEVEHMIVPLPYRYVPMNKLINIISISIGFSEARICNVYYFSHQQSDSKK